MPLDLDNVWVVANLREDQMERVRAGNPVAIALDAIPERTFVGWVESTSGGTGSVFSLFPPDNATGNFVRVVQRLPVRIRFVEAENYQNRIRRGCRRPSGSTTRPSCAAAIAFGEPGKEGGVRTRARIAAVAFVLFLPIVAGRGLRARTWPHQSPPSSRLGPTSSRQRCRTSPRKGRGAGPRLPRLERPAVGRPIGLAESLARCLRNVETVQANLTSGRPPWRGSRR